MSKEPDTKQRCVERRHMPAHVFVTYDAMCACLKKDAKPGNDDYRVYFAGAYKLANLNDRNVQSERAALEWLEENGWIVDRNPEGRRKFKGRLDTKKYRVLEHDEWLAEAPHRECPPAKYVQDEKENWYLAAPGLPAVGIVKANAKRLASKMRKALGSPTEEEVSSAFLESMAIYTLEVERRKKADACSSPLETVANTDSRLLEQASSSGLEQASTGLLEQDLFQPACKKPDLQHNHQSNLPALPQKNGGQEGREVFVDSSDSQWRELINGLDEDNVMRAALPTPAQKEEVLGQIRKYGLQRIIEGLDAWAEQRDPPLSGRIYGRWGCWLAEGTPFLRT
jgi:hypothetical protein